MHNNKQLHIRALEASDNKTIAEIIRQSLLDFNAAKPGTVYYDETTDHLFELFSNPKSTYFILMLEDEMIGGGGIFPTHGLESDTCELVKLYIKAKYRGLGFGKLLMDHCIDQAQKLKYKKIYLETMPELSIAIPLYEKYGFKYLQRPLGNSYHEACGIWMLMEM